MPTSECSFDGLGFRLNFAYTSGALGATVMPFSAELFCSMSHEATIDVLAKVILAIIQPMKVVAGALSAAELTRNRALSVLALVIAVSLISEKCGAS